MEVTLKTKYKATILSISSNPGLILREKDSQNGYMNPHAHCIAALVYNSHAMEVT